MSQIYYGNGQPWDDHADILNHRNHAAKSDRPIAALLADLKSRGLLDDTLVVWGGEFGRTPTAQGSKGRDHHSTGFSMWLAGGGVKGATSMAPPTTSASPPSRTRSTSTTSTPRSFTSWAWTTSGLTYRYSGRDFRLTDVHGEVVRDIMS